MFNIPNISVAIRDVQRHYLLQKARKVGLEVAETLHQHLTLCVRSVRTSLIGMLQCTFSGSGLLEYFLQLAFFDLARS